jgi:uncharacterized protein
MSRDPSRQIPPKNIRALGAGMHLSGLLHFPLGYVLLHDSQRLLRYVSSADLLLFFFGIECCFFVGVPFILWCILRTKHPFLDQQGQSLLNLQISIVIYLTIFLLLGTFLFFQIVGPKLQGIVLMLFAALTIAVLTIIYAVIVIFQLCVILVAALKAYRGNTYRYPFSLNFLKM